MTEPHSLPRRAFLRAAAGAALIGLEVGRAQAAVSVGVPVTAPSLAFAFWNGTRLVDARRLTTGDTTLRGGSVCLRVSGHVGGEALRALNAHYPVVMDGAERHVPFHAWTRAAHGSPSARFLMPVASGEGILLSALHGQAETFGRLHVGSAPGRPKLRPGLYVIAAGPHDWAGCRFDPEALAFATGPLTRRTLGGFVPAPFGYRVISIERA